MNFLNQFLPIHLAIKEFVSNSQAQLLPISDEFGLMEANINGESIEMRSHAWQSALFGYIRLTHLTSHQRIEMLNLTIYPRSSYDTPIFATDFVMLNGRLRVAVIDAMPLFADEPPYYQQWVLPFEPLHLRSLIIAPQYERKLDWSFRYLSPFACLATDVGAETLPQLFELWTSYFQLYLRLAQASTSVSVAREEQVKQWHKDYNHSHLTVENKRNPLVHYFGETLGKRYNSEFLFASRF